MIRKTAMLESIIQITGIPVIITDMSHKLLYKNQHAHIILERERLSGNRGHILDAIKENAETLRAGNLSRVTSQVTTYYLDDAYRFTLQTVIADSDPTTLITTISTEGEEQDFNYLKDFLTSQEINIMKQVAAGYNNTEIAENLHISINTVKYHMKQIFQKMDVSTRAELLTKAYASRKDFIVRH